MQSGDLCVREIRSVALPSANLHKYLVHFAFEDHLYRLPIQTLTET